MKTEEQQVRVIIETPKGSKQKFDYEPEQNIYVLNKVMPAGMVFPFDFGFIPGTLGEDGDPLDVLVISTLGTFTGCALDCRIVGAIKADQREKDGRKMENDRIIAVPIIDQNMAKIETIHDLEQELITQIGQFFINYNELAGKSFKIKGLTSPAATWKLISEGEKKNNRQDTLVQLFIPITESSIFNRTLQKLQKSLTEKFGGLSLYTRQPIKGIWQDGNQTEYDKLIVVEVMTAHFNAPYWKEIKSNLEKTLHQKEIIIRHYKVSTLKDS
ncbi:hypothetical protein ASE74_15725 [Pedobacter sp. Leaf216]|uniref:inorganic diphosphatase n=1 Tax=Pedobacter sp. Leaf216 TaxID=1735684 RepID=UPI0006F246B7|nr:inorganic diphosphatase [Pedobacter sp. Leaf216]KQM77849.1 hypothetical protein ASE74_15725 [Pedobacter sp. Leaf216]